MNYEQKAMNYEVKNKPNSKPIKANSNPILAQKCHRKIETNPIFPVIASAEAGTKPISYGRFTHGKSKIQILEFSQ